MKIYPGVENWGYVARDFLRQFMLKSSFFKHQALMWLYKSFYAENFLNSLHDFHDRKNLRIISIPCVMSIETCFYRNKSVLNATFWTENSAQKLKCNLLTADMGTILNFQRAVPCILRGYANYNKIYEFLLYARIR